MLGTGHDDALLALGGRHDEVGSDRELRTPIAAYWRWMNSIIATSSGMSNDDQPRPVDELDRHDHDHDHGGEHRSERVAARRATALA